jgi:hypothetical protein
MSTVPDVSFDLQVPQTPFAQDDGILTPDFLAQESTLWSPVTSMLRACFEKVT